MRRIVYFTCEAVRFIQYAFHVCVAKESVSGISIRPACFSGSFEKINMLFSCTMTSCRFKATRNISTLEGTGAL